MLAKATNTTKILLVDDEPDINQAFTQMLVKKGFEVQSALSVDKALELLSSWSPDILLSDYNMPDKNGGDLLIAIRQHFPELKHKMKFIFLTGNIANVEHDARCDGIHIIEKPVRFRVLEEALLSILSTGNLTMKSLVMTTPELGRKPFHR